MNFNAHIQQLLENFDTQSPAQAVAAQIYKGVLAGLQKEYGTNYIFPEQDLTPYPQYGDAFFFSIIYETAPGTRGDESDTAEFNVIYLLSFSLALQPNGDSYIPTIGVSVAAEEEVQSGEFAHNYQKRNVGERGSNQINGGITTAEQAVQAAIYLINKDQEM